MPAKGTTNNPAGRPKGIPNRVTGELRDRINAFLNENWERVEEDLENVSPSERLRFYEKILSYALPKLQTIEYRDETDRLLSGLNDSQLDALYETLSTKLNDTSHEIDPDNEPTEPGGEDSRPQAPD